VAPELLGEVIAQLKASPPALMIDSSFGVGPGGERYGTLPPPVAEAFGSFIREHYEFAETVEFADIYRLRQ
jgi:hypothetical protein